MAQHEPQCRCGAHGAFPLPLQESLAQLKFHSTLGGFLVRGPTPPQLAAFLEAKTDAAEAKLACNSGTSPHHQMSRSEIVTSLINSCESDGYTALMHATRVNALNRVGLASVLLERGADVNLATGSMRWTVAHRVALEAGQLLSRVPMKTESAPAVVECIQLMQLYRRYGVNVNLLDANGRTSAELFQQQCASSRVRVTDDDGTPLAQGTPSVVGEDLRTAILKLLISDE